MQRNDVSIELCGISTKGIMNIMFLTLCWDHKAEPQPVGTSTINHNLQFVTFYHCVCSQLSGPAGSGTADLHSDTSRYSGAAPRLANCDQTEALLLHQEIARQRGAWPTNERAGVLRRPELVASRAAVDVRRRGR